MLTREKNKVSYMHFIMSVLVILIHSINNTTKFQKFFSIDSGIGQFAVPLFFMISGFLFFRNVKKNEDIRRKIKSRVHTLLVPFLLWNLIYYVVHLLLKPGTAFNLIELFEAVFEYTHNPAFWFMYQLILLVAISILLYYVYKKVLFIVVVLIALCIIVVTGFDIPFVNEDALIYYTSGMLFAKLYNDYDLNFISRVDVAYSFCISILFASFYIIMNRIVTNVSTDAIYINSFNLSLILIRLSFSFFIFYLCDLFFKYESVPSFMDNTFFLYAIHYMIVRALIYGVNFFTGKFVLGIYCFIAQDIVFVLSPIICIIISYFLSRFMKDKFAMTYKLLTGNR